MDVKKLLDNALKAGGYDGLYEAGECACLLGDLMPCDSEAALSCTAGYVYPADPDSEFSFMVGPKGDGDRGGCERDQVFVLTGAAINARSFYMAMIDRTIETDMEADRVYHLAEYSLAVEKCYSRATSYMRTASNLLEAAGQWRFFARMWALKWDVMHAPASVERRV